METDSSFVGYKLSGMRNDLKERKLKKCENKSREIRRQSEEYDKS
jgi:hypothetical protein